MFSSPKTLKILIISYYQRAYTILPILILALFFIFLLYFVSCILCSAVNIGFVFDIFSCPLRFASRSETVECIYPYTDSIIYYSFPFSLFINSLYLHAIRSAQHANTIIRPPQGNCGLILQIFKKISLRLYPLTNIRYTLNNKGP